MTGDTKRYLFEIWLNDDVISAFKTDADPPHIGGSISLTRSVLSEPFKDLELDQKFVVTQVEHLFGYGDGTKIVITLKHGASS